MLNLARARAGALLRRRPAVGAAAAAARRFAATDAGPLAALRTRAAATFDELMDAEWVDEESTALIADKVDAMMNDYRPLYSAEAVSADGEDKETYEAVRKAYVAAEASKLVELYADHMTYLMRDHMEMTGGLGNETKLDEKDAERASKTLREYVSFLNAIEVVRVRRKAEAQLGRKAVLLRQVLSVDQFAADFHPVACDHMVTTPRRQVAPTPPSPPSS